MSPVEHEPRRGSAPVESPRWLHPALLVAGIVLMTVSLVRNDGRAGAVTAVACLLVGVSLSGSARFLNRRRQ